MKLRHPLRVKIAGWEQLEKASPHQAEDFELCPLLQMKIKRPRAKIKKLTERTNREKQGRVRKSKQLHRGHE
jgi:hypothetical protein